MIDLYVTFNGEKIEPVDFYEIGTSNVYSVESYDKTTCDGEITTARLGKSNVRTSDVDFFVAGEAQGFDAIVQSVEKRYEQGSAERGVLLALCKYSRVKPYTLFDGFINVKRVKLFDYELRKKVMSDIFNEAEKLGLDDELTLSMR